MILATVMLATTLPQLHVEGNQVLDKDNKPVRLRGVNAACLEWSSDGEGHLLDTIRVAAEWKCNIVRLPLSQDRWFGKAPEQKDGGKAYRALVKQAADLCKEKSMYVLLDLHWNNAGDWGQNIGQHVMPDMYSLEFWRDCAKAYKNVPHVLFDLYNEPHDTTWDIWRDGGEITEKPSPWAKQGAMTLTYKTPGMKALLEVVRKSGARNVVVVGGLDWSYDLSGFLNGYDLKDPKGNGVIYACHDYPMKGDTIDKFLVKLDAALPKFPVIISEFGGGGWGNASAPDAWVVRTMQEIDKRGVHYTAWDMHPSAAPCLIKDWKYTPTPYFGVVVKEALSK